MHQEKLCAYIVGRVIYALEIWTFISGLWTLARRVCLDYTRIVYVVIKNDDINRK